MATTAGILNQRISAAAQALAEKSAVPMASSTNGTSGANGSGDASSGEATISANDFLTLLVTEMRNQDPTADTDPNEYISQLVQVNSLEQLININQTLTTDLGSSTSSSSSSQAVGTASGPSTIGTSSIVNVAHDAAHAASDSPIAQVTAAAGSASAMKKPLAQPAEGNLSVPSVNRAAQRVAHALDGRTRAQPTGSSL